MTGGQPIVWYRTGPVTAVGGAEVVTVHGLTRFSDLGHPVVLLQDCAPEEDRGAPFDALDVRRAYLQPSPAVSYAGGPIARLRSFIQRVQGLRRTIRALEPAVIVAGGIPESALLWLYSGFGLLKLPPLVTFVHGSPFQYADELTKYALAFRRHLPAIRDADPVYRQVIPAAAPPMSQRARLALELSSFMRRAGVRMSRLVLVLTPKNRDEARLLYGCRRVVAVAPGGYTAAELDAAFQARPPQGAEVSPTILSVCRLVAKKRVDLIVRAYRALLDRHPSTAARLVIAGSGLEEASLRALADQLGLAGRIEFTGFLADAELDGLYRAASVFVSADNADYDLTVMTALAHGARTVVSVQYSLPEFLVSTRRLLVVAQPDADGFAEALHTALTASAPPPSLDGYAELSRMTWERYFDQVIEEIRAVAPLPPTAAEPAPRAADPAAQPRLVSA